MLWEGGIGVHVELWSILDLFIPQSLNRSLQAKVSKFTDEASVFERAKKEFEATERELTTLTAARNVLIQWLLPHCYHCFSCIISNSQVQ